MNMDGAKSKKMNRNTSFLLRLVKVLTKTKNRKKSPDLPIQTQIKWEAFALVFLYRDRSYVSMYVRTLIACPISQGGL